MFYALFSCGWCEVFVCECKAQQQAMHLARLHQKHSSLAAAAAAAASSITQSTQTAADTTNMSAPSASARPNNAPLTGTLEIRYSCSLTY